MNTEIIKKLAKIAYDRRENFRCLGTVNANHPDPIKREALTVAYEIARTEMFEAYVDLSKEQRSL